MWKRGRFLLPVLSTQVSPYWQVAVRLRLPGACSSRSRAGAVDAGKLSKDFRGGRLRTVQNEKSLIHFTLQISHTRSWCCGILVVEVGALEPSRKSQDICLEGEYATA